MDNCRDARVLEARLRAMFDQGKGASPGSLARLFSLPLECVKLVLNIPEPLPPKPPSLLERLGLGH